MVDKNYCMSAYVALRYIVDSDKEFYEETKHINTRLFDDSERISVKTAVDIDKELKRIILSLKDKKLGILLSGGMDSAILASYLPGGDAYTFRFMGGEYQKEELNRAEKYAEYYGLKLHYVDIEWSTVEKNLDNVMKVKGAPVHSIEPQLVQAALQAKEDGIEMLIIGNGSDYVFGGMDGLLSKDWSFEEFYKRYIYIDPEEVLKEPVDMRCCFEKYRRGNDIDFLGVMEDIAIEESYSSYYNAFKVAEIEYIDPYAYLKMAEPLDLNRVRNGESKYLIRELFSMKYPYVEIPDKLPMPRPVDSYFADWEGPKRPEFVKGLDMTKYTGNQKWLLYCLERFLDMYEPKKISIID